MEFIGVEEIRTYTQAIEVLKKYSEKPEKARKLWLENEEYLQKFPEDVGKSLDEFLFGGNCPFLDDIILLPVDNESNTVKPPNKAVYRVRYFGVEENGGVPIIIGKTIREIYDRAEQQHQLKSAYENLYSNIPQSIGYPVFPKPEIVFRCFGLV
ncbi:MAG: hypothetical protein KAT28_01790 [Candidatus Aenigmarchaeota archaeon]|nr:hypothetical protein [Candidatus Aenigmarchaeota archaeon]